MRNLLTLLTRCILRTSPRISVFTPLPQFSGFYLGFRAPGGPQKNLMSGWRTSTAGGKSDVWLENKRSRAKIGSLALKNPRFIASVVSLALCSQGVFSATRVGATSPETAPPELQNLIGEIDAAANRKDIQGVMQYYSPNFTHSDGLTYESLQQGLRQLWRRYSRLNYRTELQSWEVEGNAIVAETVTVITGFERAGGRELSLSASVRSRQRYENQQIVQQEILAENSQITSGKNPPKLNVNLPEEVDISERYHFDAIVQQPLDNDLLLGSALEEPVTVNGYIYPTRVEVEPLASGGIFKVGEAPNSPNNLWISAVLVRYDGITIITRRMRAIAPNRPSASSKEYPY